MSDLTGMRFGRLTVIAAAGIKSRQRQWRCVCDCGGTKVVAGSSLKSGCTKSCGCLNSETARKARTSHGMFGAPEYNSWAAMIQRCTNEKEKRFADYGGRGIKVCARWLESFENFYADMGERPEGMTLDRKENDGNYEPSNCRWATKLEQSSINGRIGLLSLKELQPRYLSGAGERASSARQLSGVSTMANQRQKR